jgi:hypothetical protein
VPLAAATVCAVLLCGWTAVDLRHVQRTYASAETTALEPLLSLWRIRSAAADADGQAGVATLLASQCPTGAACQSSVAVLRRAVTAAAVSASLSQRATPDSRNDPGESLLTRTLAASQLVRDEVATGAIPRATADSQQGEATFNTVDAALVTRTQIAQKSLRAQLDSARNTPGLQVGIPILSVMIALLILAGISSRLEEYRT